MNGFLWFLLGALAGWLVELVIDYRYWRRQAKIAHDELSEKGARLDSRAQELLTREQILTTRDAEARSLQAALNARDAELLAQAKRVDERAEELERNTAILENRRAEMDRLSSALNERDRDSSARQQNLKRDEQQVATRTTALDESEADLARRLAAVTNRESASTSWEEKLNTREIAIAQREVEFKSQGERLASMRVEHAGLKTLVARQYRDADGKDRLSALPGIDEETASLLARSDIASFERLAETPLGELTRVLESAGPKRALVNPLDWAEQAALLADGDYLAFDRMQQALRGTAAADSQVGAEAGPGVNESAEASGPESSRAAVNESAESAEKSSAESVVHEPAESVVHEAAESAVHEAVDAREAGGVDAKGQRDQAQSRKGAGIQQNLPLSDASMSDDELHALSMPEGAFPSFDGQDEAWGADRAEGGSDLPSTGAGRGAASPAAARGDHPERGN